MDENKFVEQQAAIFKAREDNRLTAREKELLVAIQEANFCFESWIRQPAWACEAYDDFNKAWETLINLSRRLSRWQ